MAIRQTTEPDLAEQQLKMYNENMGGNLNLSTEATLSAGTRWMTAACMLNKNVTADIVTDVLVPAISQLTGVSGIYGDQLYGVVPASIIASGYEPRLNITAYQLGRMNGNTRTFADKVQLFTTIKPPLDRKWAVVSFGVTSELDASKILALETAVEQLSGVINCKHLMDGYVSPRVVNDVSFQVHTHLRIEPVTV